MVRRSPGLVPRSHGAHVHEARHPRRPCGGEHRPGPLYVDGCKRLRALLDDDADEVDDRIGALGDRTALERLARGADAIVHLVGIIVEQGPQTFAAVHVEGTGAMLAAARAAGVSRFVHMSAVGARDEPGATPYHRTKRQAEQLVRDSGLSHAILQPSIMNG